MVIDRLISKTGKYKKKEVGRVGGVRFGHTLHQVITTTSSRGILLLITKMQRYMNPQMMRTRDRNLK